MSGKRPATTDLNHDNWDQEDSKEPEDTEGFKMASKEVLEKRVIRTAKRRSNANEGQKSVFSGFGGFNKTQKTSFDFLANLTNGKPITTTTASNQEGSFSLFTAKPQMTSPNPGLFMPSEISKPNLPPPLEKPSMANTSNVTTSPTIETKTESKVNDSPFKIQKTSSPVNSFSFTPKPSTETSPKPETATNLFSSNVQNIFAKNPFKTSTPTHDLLASRNDKLVVKKDMSHEKESDGDKVDEKKIKYHTYIKALNESVSEWIKKHVDETPVCILTPIFKDYEKHLKEIQEEYFGTDEPKPNGEKGDCKQDLNKDSKNTPVSPALNVFSKSASNNSTNSLPEQKKTNNFTFGMSTSSNTPTKNTMSEGFSFGNVTKAQSSLITSNVTQAPIFGSGFSFAASSTTTSSTLTTPATFSLPTTSSSVGFTFGTNTPPQTSSLFSAKPIMSTTNGSSPFSFGTGKPFSFNSNIQKKEEDTKEKSTKDDADEPPKVEYTPLIEENSVYDKKCKIFVKKDGNFVDKGVGTLYIKKIEGSGKHQLLVRANTALGNIMLNLVLGSAIPTQRMAKNNVMLVCIPTPDAKPTPTPVLIRVKTAEEADELLETLNKYKM